MPNWCMNRLTVTGDEHERMAELWRADNVLSTVIPEPVEYSRDDLAKLQEFADTQAWMKRIVTTENAPDWWRLMHWGTDRDVVEAAVVTASNDATVIQFRTAWSPPNAGLRTISGLYPTLRCELKCYEPLWSFAAHTVFLAGEIISDECHECGAGFTRIVAECGWEEEEVERDATD